MRYDNASLLAPILLQLMINNIKEQRRKSRKEVGLVVAIKLLLLEYFYGDAPATA